MKFCLLTIGRKIKEAHFAFFLTNPTQISEAERRFVLSAEDIAHINPNTRTAPIFRSCADADLTRNICERHPVLIEDARGAASNRLGIFMRQGLFNVNQESGLLMTKSELGAVTYLPDGMVTVTPDGATFVPLIEAKMLGAYDHRGGSYASRGGERGFRVLPETSIEDYQNSGHFAEPFYWVDSREAEGRVPNEWRNNWLLAYKDITHTTNERSMIACIMPRYLCDLTVRVVFGHLQAHSAAYLLAAFNSIIFDYLIRQKINGLHLSDYIVKQVPIPIPEKFGKDDLSFVVPRVLEMTYVARDVRSFAYDLEYHGPPFVWQEDRRAWLRAELDAYFARLYGLTREELLYILDPAFVKRADYPSETFRVLRNIDETKYGEYRTARLVMQAWDGLAVKGNVA